MKHELDERKASRGNNLHDIKHVAPLTKIYGKIRMDCGEGLVRMMINAFQAELNNSLVIHAGSATICRVNKRTGRPVKCGKQTVAVR